MILRKHSPSVRVQVASLPASEWPLRYHLPVESEQRSKDIFQSCIQVSQRDRTNRMCIYRQIYFKEFAHEVVEPWQVQNLREARRLETQEKSCNFGVQRQSVGRIPFS